MAFLQTEETPYTDIAMNQTDLEYHNLLKLVLERGKRKKNRTGVDTFGVFGAQARFDLSESFPLLTTKKMFWKGIVHELLWFISGDANIKYLVDQGVNIWNANAFAKFKKSPANQVYPFSAITEEQFINALKNADMTDPVQRRWVEEHGNLGEGTYGSMWRRFPYAIEEFEMLSQTTGGGQQRVRTKYVDQLDKVILQLRKNPDDRRIIVSAWHPYWVDHCALPPCHVMFHFNTEELTEDERYFLLIKQKPYADDCSQSEIRDLLTDIPTRRLNCLMYQRSCDLFLGVPFNIASYALLTQLVASCVGMAPGEFIHTYGDLHLYENHIEQAKEQLTRESMSRPTVKITPGYTNIFAIDDTNITLENYVSHPSIQAKMAV